MLKEVLTKSGRRIPKAIKKLSTRSRLVRKSQDSGMTPQYERNNCRSAASCPDDPESPSPARRSIMSRDMSRSTDTRLTDVTAESMADDECTSICCCHWRQLDDNRRNENRENEETRLIRNINNTYRFN